MLVINAKTKNYADVVGITGSDEVWFNDGDGRYYTGSSRAIGGAVLGVIDGTACINACQGRAARPAVT